MQRGCTRTLAMASNGAGSGAGAAKRWLQAAAATAKSGARVRMGLSSDQPQLAFEWQLADPLAGGREDRVGHRGPRDRRTRLTDAAGLLGAADEMDLDLGRLVDPQHA